MIADRTSCDDPDDLDDTPPPAESLPLVQYLAQHRRHLLRVALVGESVFDVVRHAGGWIYDQTALGCHATVIAADDSNATSLAVLGARFAALEEARRQINGPWPHVLLIASSLYRCDRAVSAAVDEIGRRRFTTVFFFGTDVSTGTNTPIERVVYELSSATMAFKKCALRMCDADPPSTLELFGRTPGKQRRKPLVIEPDHAPRAGWDAGPTRLGQVFTTS